MGYSVLGGQKTLDVGDRCQPLYPRCKGRRILSGIRSVKVHAAHDLFKQIQEKGKTTRSIGHGRHLPCFDTLVQALKLNYDRERRDGRQYVNKCLNDLECRMPRQPWLQLFLDLFATAFSVFIVALAPKLASRA